MHHISRSIHTVDGRNPKQPPGMHKTLHVLNLVNNVINYQPQLVSRIFVRQQ